MPRIPRTIVDELIAHAVDEGGKKDVTGMDGIEACGFVLGKHGDPTDVVRARNAEQSRFKYNMDGQDILGVIKRMQETGEEVFAIYHSHVASEAYPSHTDRRMAFSPPLEDPDFRDAAEDRLIYPDAYYILVSLASDPPSVRAFKSGGDAVPQEEPVEVD